MDPVVLGPTEQVPGRPFTDVEATDRDLVMLREMVSDLRGVLEEAAEGTGDVVEYHQMAWRVENLSHRLMVCNEERLRTHPGLYFVGFCSDRRKDLDITELERMNTALVALFPEIPNILSYSSVKAEDGDWANLVVHEEPEDRERWRQGELHTEAVQVLSPIHYRSIRIHNGHLSRPLLDGGDMVITKTKYYAFEDGSRWDAERDLTRSIPT